MKKLKLKKLTKIEMSKVFGGMEVRNPIIDGDEDFPDEDYLTLSIEPSK